MFQTTRRRLALWYAVVTAVLLSIFATGVYLYARATLIDRVDDTLKHVVEVVERSLEIDATADPQSIAANFRVGKALEVGGPEADRIDLEWFDPAGHLLRSTFSEPLATVPLERRRAAETVSLSADYALRQLTDPIVYNRQLLGYLRASHPWFEVAKPTQRLLVDLACVGAIAVGCVAAIGWWLSGLAIQPVRDAYQSLKQFTADASHELRNPIATIQTNVQLALTEPERDAQQQRLQAIDRLAQRLSRLVGDLLFLARADSGTVETKRQPVPLDALLLAVVAEQEGVAARRGASLRLHLPDTAPELSETEAIAADPFNLEGDWDQLARLFTNLIANALEHAQPPEDEPLSINVELQEVGDRKSPALEVCVRDNGLPLPPETRLRVFDRFYRESTHRSGANGSSGLGLAIARAIATNHRGQLRLQSSDLSGTIFAVILPKVARGVMPSDR